MITPQQIRMARAGLNWTLEDLAKKAKINPNTLSRYERGQDVLLSTLAKAEQALRHAGVTFIDDHTGIGVVVAAQKALPNAGRRSRPQT